MCRDQLWNFTGNITILSSPTGCTVPSISALEHNYISGRVHTPKKRQSQAFHLYILNPGITEPSLKEESQWIRDAYTKIQGVPFRSEELWDYIHFFYKILFKKGLRIQFMFCCGLRQWVSMLHVLVVSLQASFHFPPEPQIPLGWNTLSPE